MIVKVERSNPNVTIRLNIHVYRNQQMTESALICFTVGFIYVYALTNKKFFFEWHPLPM